MEAMEKVKRAREKDRPKITDYIEHICTDFFEQKGDRLGKDDESIYGGIGLFHDIPVTIIGHRKGNNIKENIEYNFGMPGPEGYRKALRIMKQAEKFGRPIITFVDTPGAYPGMEAEMYGQSKAIADNLAAMSAIEVPVISIITGEGSSGGALGIAVGNKVYMLENAVYSILSPEGFASILWHDATKVEKAADMMKLTANDLLDMGVIDAIISEDGMNSSDDFYKRIDKAIYEDLLNMTNMSVHDLKQHRYERYRKIDERFI